MTDSRLKIAALSFAAALATTTMTFVATTSPAFAAERTSAPEVRIVHRDLNLAAASGERALRARVKNAAETLCVHPSEIALKAQMIGRACIVSALERAEPQVQAAVERQRAAQYAARTPR